MFKRVVDVVEWLVLAGAAVVVVCLFVVGGDDGGGGEEATPGADGPGADVYAESCASCHGSDGGGGIGPQLAGGAVVEAYPEPADQILVITEGRNGMPAFGDQLSATDIEAVTEYTRSL